MNMILGTGIDLLKISRVKKVLDKYGQSFVKKVFSDDEIKNNKETTFKANKLPSELKSIPITTPGSRFIK